MSICWFDVVRLCLWLLEEIWVSDVRRTVLEVYEFDFMFCISISVLTDHNIVRFKVTVNIADRVQLFKQGEDLTANLDGSLHRKLLLQF